MNNSEFFEAVRLLSKEKNVSESALLEGIQRAIVTAVKRDYNNKDIVFCEIDEQDKKIRVFVRKNVVGEITDESDSEETFYHRINANTYLFDGKTHIGDFERIVEIAEGTFADVKGRAETLAGLMLELKCDFLKKGDTVTAHGVRFTVEEIEGHRIDKIKVRLHG